MIQLNGSVVVLAPMQPLRDTATNVLRDLLATQPDTAAKVEFAWRLAAGPAMARATSIAWTDRGVLIVRARDAEWRREVLRARPTIAARLDRMLGAAVTTIHVEED
jgi:hypothetical protein